MIRIVPYSFLMFISFFFLVESFKRSVHCPKFKNLSLRSIMIEPATANNIDINNDRFNLINIFGRLAEQKALGFTSTYNTYLPTPLSLWLPNRWSRRLRVDSPDWKRLFGGSTTINRSQFEINLKTLPFKYPVDCPVPNDILTALEVDSKSTSNVALMSNDTIRSSIEMIFQTNFNPSSTILDTTYFMFGGGRTSEHGNQLYVDVMESFILEWGRLAGADDPVIDWPIFESQMIEKLAFVKKQLL